MVNGLYLHDFIKSDTKHSMRNASYLRRVSALGIDSIWWTVVAHFVPLGPSMEDLLMDQTPSLRTFFYGCQ
jgi:hypothetical protein